MIDTKWEKGHTDEQVDDVRRELPTHSWPAWHDLNHLLHVRPRRRVLQQLLPRRVPNLHSIVDLGLQACVLANMLEFDREPLRTVERRCRLLLLRALRDGAWCSFLGELACWGGCSLGCDLRAEPRSSLRAQASAGSDQGLCACWWGREHVPHLYARYYSSQVAAI
jgi:hypothetical protein